MSQYTYNQIADLFISLSNETQNLITNLKLQKLMYYAQAWHLTITGNRLFDGEFQAWVHGPVLTQLYDDYKGFKWNPIVREDLNESSFNKLRENIDEKTLDILDEIIDEYFGLTAYELERLTHTEEPWLKARKGKLPDEPSQEIIKDEWMIEYYKKYLIEN